MSGKIKTIKELQQLVASHKNKGRKVALITGCFDVLHLGHIKLFRYAKKYADILVVGLDSDKTIEVSKGKDRPVNKISVRCDQLSEMESVDFIFKLEKDFGFSQKEADIYQEYLYKTLQPTYIVTNPLADSFWRKKQERTKKFGIQLLKDYRSRSSASSKIINKILEREL